MSGGGCGCSKMRGGGGRGKRTRTRTKMRRGGTCSKMRGGTCGGMCQKMPMAGGNHNLPTPGPLVGRPWTPDSTGNDNYYADNMYPTDVQMNTMSSATQNDLTNTSLSNQIVGGGRRSRRRGRGRGGGFIPQDLVNFGRSFGDGLGSAYNSLAGLPQGRSSLPYLDQLPNTPTAGQLRY